MFEKTPINPELVSSIDHVYRLREIARQFFVDQNLQSLKVQNEVERSRSIVALVDVLQRSDRVGRVLIISQLSAVLEKIELSFKLHTASRVLYLDTYTELKEVNLARPSTLFDVIGYDNSNINEVLSQFDLIIVDDLNNEKNQILKLKLLHNFKGWILNILPLETPATIL